MAQRVTLALEGQIAELVSAYPQLAVVRRRQAETTIAGPLAFEAAPDDLEAISVSFDIELTVPHTFPKRLPRATETGGRIRGADYEHVFTDGTLCLGVPIQQRRVLSEQPTLLGFVERLLIPYLYGFCFWRKHGRHPFGEAAHGPEGILQHYLDLLGLDDPLAVLGAIRLLCERGYDARQRCPCGSGRRVRDCHRAALRGLHNHHTPETLRTDFRAIYDACHQRFQRGQLSFPRPMRRQLHRLLKRLQRPTHHLGSVHASR
ncbi:MAG: hypothetical protein OXH52_02035 [Gammaproteobacteria bacterium]|nr:hypothetical protein [Gammaproteobacteria bacterium]